MTPKEEAPYLIQSLIKFVAIWEARTTPEDITAALGALASIMTTKCDDPYAIALGFVKEYVTVFDKEIDRIMETKK